MSRSTTRRCATGRSSRASRSPSRTSCASRSSSTGSASHYIEAGWPGANPKDDELFRRAPSELQLDDAHARRVRLDPARQGQGRQRRHAAAPRRGERRHRVHRRQVVGLPRARGARHDARRGRGDGRATRSSSCAARAWTCCSTPSTSSTATSATPSSRCACSRPRRRTGASHLVLCDTNGGALPHEVERIVARGRRRTSVATSASRCTCTTTRGTGVANALAGVLGGATQVQGTINGYGERTGNCNLTTIIPNLTLKMGIETIPRRPARAAHAGRAPRRRAREHAAQPAGGVRRALGVRAQGRPAHERDRQAARRVRARARPTSVGNGTRFVVSELAGKSTLGLKAKELGLELDGPQLAEVVETLKRLEHEGYHFEVADGSLELLMRRATGWEPDWFDVESFRVITDDRTRRRRRSPTRRGATVTTEATVKVHVGGERVHRDRRGQRSGERARPRAAEGAQRHASRARARAPHRLQGARARHEEGHRRGHAGADRLDRRRRRRGPRSASTRTSSRRRGRRCSTRSSSACCAQRERRAGHERRLASAACPPIRSSPPDLDDRPRQQQNLPPGVALPPARRWRADRPGDLVGPAQPRRARCSAGPGPNVGYAYTLAERVRATGFELAPHEHVRRRRSRWSPRSRASAPRRSAGAPVIGDVEVAIDAARLRRERRRRRSSRCARGSCTKPRTTTRAGARSSTRSPSDCCGASPTRSATSRRVAARAPGRRSRAASTADDVRRAIVRPPRRVRGAARVGAAPRRGPHRAERGRRPTSARSIPWASWERGVTRASPGLPFPEEYGGQGGGILAHAIARRGGRARVCASSSLFTFISKLGDDAGARPRFARS